MYFINKSGPDGVLLYPSHTSTAPYHAQALLRLANFSYTSIFNALGLPSTQCPLGLGSQGTPMGIQVLKINLTLSLLIFQYPCLYTF